MLLKYYHFSLFALFLSDLIFFAMISSDISLDKLKIIKLSYFYFIFLHL